MIICGRWKMDDDRNNRKSISSSLKSTSCCNNLTYPVPHHITHHYQQYIIAEEPRQSCTWQRPGTAYCVTNFPSFPPVHNIHMSAINQFRRPPGGKKCEDYPPIVQHEHNCMFLGSTLLSRLGETGVAGPGITGKYKKYLNTRRGTDRFQVITR